jgi:hypothetical protein
MASTRTITLDGEYAGWQAELRTGVSARILLDLESGSSSRALEAFAKMVVSHNFKGLDGTPVDDILDAPIDALSATLEAWGKANQPNPK